ncbi:GxxExxY protein [Romboutsia sp.]|uniref:GxxExxY protein n=1 Tax=Romboutsia sp. TaxID=1965302 RepID=UPI003F317EAA
MKNFNTTGTCIEKKHYMVNIDEKISKMEKIIDNGDYFVINKPRQFGKTTTISKLSKKLKEKYIIIRSSFEGLGDDLFKNEEHFCNTILDVFADTLQFIDKEKSIELRELSKNSKNMNDLSKAITRFIINSNKEVVLFIDEIDKSSNNQLFISFLGMLRNKYLLSQEELDYTFKSVVLAGVHDIKNLKVLVRQGEEQKYNSPWNIAVNFDIDMAFNEEEIETMIKEYAKLNNVDMDTKSIAKELYYYTNGYPFLVSRLCQIIDEVILKKEKQPWSKDNINKSVKLILQEKNTLFDSLIKNLENNIEFKRIIEKIILMGEEIVYVPSDNLISMGEMYGFIKNEEGRCKIHNRIFEQYIYNHITSITSRNDANISKYNYRENFITNEGGLDFKKILYKFQEFMKKEYSSVDVKFIEREGRLLFLAFIKPIVNGVGFDFKEVMVSEEKRLDVVITYNNFKYIVELKIWYGEEYHKKGIKQLVDYLNIQGLEKGYLLIFNFNKNKEYKHETINIDNKEIVTVYV